MTLNNILYNLRQFIYKYYIHPLTADTSYNPVDTLTYALLLAASILLVLKLLKKLNVRIDVVFLLAVVPYILAGSTMRVMEDAEIVQPPVSYLFITPPIYFLIFTVTFLFLVLSIEMENRGRINDYRRLFGSLGLGWLVLNLAFILQFTDIKRPLYGLLIVFLGFGLTYLVYRVALELNFLAGILTEKVNLGILLAHLLDASSTFVGMDLLGYTEKHVVPTFIINLTGTALVMYPLKLAVFIPILYIIDTSKEDENMTWLLKLAILVLGLSPAARNTLRIILGT